MANKKKRNKTYLTNDTPKLFYNEDTDDNDVFTKKIHPSFAILLLYLFAILFLLYSFLFFTESGRRIMIRMAGSIIYSNLDYQPSNKLPMESQPGEGQLEETKSGETQSGSAVLEQTQTSDVQTGESMETAYFNSGKAEAGQASVINILLIGIEEFNGDKNTDSMIIASMDTEDHTLKLTSLMRDLYIDIPGHSKGRLNSVYAKGGIELLYKTIEKNFKVRVDGYCLVNFEAFEKIVNLLGGVEVTLTPVEADYLNTSKYISNPIYRNVVEGSQIMNGNQALGYCRVRYVPTSTESNDFGRTQRQRNVLQAIYDKLRSKNVVQQLFLINDILSQVNVQTDITQKEFDRYFEEAVNIKMKDIQTLRIPTDENYENARVRMGSHYASVLQLKDTEAAQKSISDFIYGDNSEEDMD